MDGNGQPFSMDQMPAIECRWVKSHPGMIQGRFGGTSTWADRELSTVSRVHHPAEAQSCAAMAADFDMSDCSFWR